MTADVWSLASLSLRALSLVASMQAAGLALFGVIFAREIEATVTSLRRQSVFAAILALVFVALYQLLQPARMTGELSGVLDGSMQRLAWSIPGGIASSVLIAGLAVLAVSAASAFRFATAIQVAGVLLVVCSFTFSGHTADLQPRPVFAALLIAHLLIVAFWFGALGPLYASTKQESAGRSARLIERFSMLATWLVPGIFVVGVVLAVALVRDLASLRSPYGVLILMKAAGFSALMLLAALNKRRFGPRIAAGETRARVALRVSIAIEWLLIVAVLITTATLTTFFSPPEAA